MFNWTLSFFFASMLAGLWGFAGVEESSKWAQTVFFCALTLALLTLGAGLLGERQDTKPGKYNKIDIL